jgi:hypothetical protein
MASYAAFPLKSHVAVRVPVNAESCDPHVPEVPTHAFPEATAAQVPFTTPVSAPAQDMQSPPPHAVLQQTPVTQKLLVHWSAVAHTVPAAPFVAHVCAAVQ